MNPVTSVIIHTFNKIMPHFSPIRYEVDQLLTNQRPLNITQSIIAFHEICHLIQSNKAVCDSVIEYFKI